MDFAKGARMLFADGVSAILQRVAERYNLNFTELRRDFVLPILDDVSAVPVAANVAVLAAPAAPSIALKPVPKIPAELRCKARAIRGDCTRKAAAGSCYCALHLRLLAKAPAEVPKVPVEAPVVPAVVPVVPVEAPVVPVEAPVVPVEAPVVPAEVQDIGDVPDEDELLAAELDRLLTMEAPKLPMPTFLAEYGGVDEVDRRIRESIENEQKTKSRAEARKTARAAAKKKIIVKFKKPQPVVDESAFAPSDSDDQVIEDDSQSVWNNFRTSTEIQSF